MESIAFLKRNILKQKIKKAIFSLLALVFLFPVVWLLLQSVLSQKGGMEVSLMPYYEILFAEPQYLYKFWNSLSIVFLILAGQLVLSCMAGAAFSHYRFRGHSFWLVLLILFTFLPVQAVLVPDYWVLSRLHLTDTYWALILPNIFSPLGVLLMSLIFNNVQKEILEAAKLDGAGSVQILLHMLIPCGKSGIASFFVISFADCWNMVEQPMVFLGNARDYPLSVFLAVMNEQNISRQFACAILCFIPLTLLFLFFHNELSEGITSAVVK